MNGLINDADTLVLLSCYTFQKRYCGSALELGNCKMLKFFWGSGILYDERTPSPNFFPKTANIA